MPDTPEEPTSVPAEMPSPPSGQLIPKNRWNSTVLAIYTHRADRDIQLEVESVPELFYFVEGRSDAFMAKYIENLVALNPILQIDDLVYESLTRFDDPNMLFWLSRLLEWRSFSGTTLRHIFNSVVFLDTAESDERTLHKYRVLAAVIAHYKAGDQYILNELRILNAGSAETNDEAEERLPSKGSVVSSCDAIGPPRYSVSKYKIINEYLERREVSTDNAQVLANIAWENTIDILASQADEFEANCILELFATAIRSTGSFYQNRVRGRIAVFEKLRGLSSFKSFVDAICENFDRAQDAFPELVESSGGKYIVTK